MLIADQQRLLKLALVFRVDINCLIESIELDCRTQDEKARARFIEGTFRFLRKAIGLNEVQSYLSELLDQKSVINSGTCVQVNACRLSLPTVPDQPSFTASHSVITQDPISIRPVIQPSHPLTFPTIQKPPTSPYHAYKKSIDQGTLHQTRINPTTYISSRPTAPSAVTVTVPSDVLGGVALHLLSPKDMRQGVPSIKISRGRVIYIKGAPRTATTSLISQQVCGGALEFLGRYPQEPKVETNFLVVFITPEAAAEYMAFKDTPGGQLQFPGGASRCTIRWNNLKDSGIETRALKAAKDPKNPRRRVIIFQGYQGNMVDANDLRRKLDETNNRVVHFLALDDFHVYRDRMEGHAIFNSIEAAMNVMELHRRQLLGGKFNHCKAVYGRDPCDRPIPSYKSIQRTVTNGIAPKSLERPMSAASAITEAFPLNNFYVDPLPGESTSQTTPLPLAPPPPEPEPTVLAPVHSSNISQPLEIGFMEMLFLEHE